MKPIIAAIILLTSILISPTADATTAPQQFNVKDFGATGGGVADDAPGINAAIAVADKAAGPAVVFIPAGRYRLETRGTGAPAYLSILGAKNLTITGEAGSRLVATNLNFNIFIIRDCEHVRVSNLELDTSTLAFTQGKIDSVDVPSLTVNLHVDQGYDDLDRPDFATFQELHVVSNPASGSWDQDIWPPHIVSREKLGDRTWRLHLAVVKPTYAGKPWIVWRGIYHAWAFDVERSRDCTIEHIDGLSIVNGFVLHGNPGDVTLSYCRIGVPPGSGRLFCANGGMMIFVNRGVVTLDHCDFSRTDDDSMNMGTHFEHIIQKVDDRTLIVEKGDVDWTTGDTVAVWDWVAHKQRCIAKIVSIAHAAQGVQLSLDRAVEVDHVGASVKNAKRLALERDGIDRLIDTDTAGTLIVRNCRLSSMRARCVLDKASHSIIENNVFYNQHLPAILVGPEFYWDEGGSVTSAIIRNNRFENMDIPGIRVGEISSDTALDNRNVVIEGNDFEGLGGAPVVDAKMRGAAICVTNTDGVIIRNNRFAGQSPDAANAPAIVVGRSANVRATGNKGLTGDAIAQGTEQQMNSER